MSAGGRPSLWPRRTVRLFVAGNLLALVLVYVGFRGSAQRLIVDDQLSWVNVAAVGVAISLAVNAFVILSGRGGIHRRASVLRLRDRSCPLPGGPRLAISPADLVAAASMVRYHRRACLLVAGKAVEAQPRRAHEKAGRRACGVCGP